MPVKTRLARFALILAHTAALPLVAAALAVTMASCGGGDSSGAPGAASSANAFTQADIRAIMNTYQKAGWSVSGDTASYNAFKNSDGTTYSEKIAYSLNAQGNLLVRTTITMQGQSKTQSYDAFSIMRSNGESKAAYLQTVVSGIQYISQGIG